MNFLVYINLKVRREKYNLGKCAARTVSFEKQANVLSKGEVRKNEATTRRSAPGRN